MMSVPAQIPLQLEARVLDAQGNPLSPMAVRWASSDSSVATVDEGGLLTAKGSGSARITASVNGVADSARVVVIDPAAGTEGEDAREPEPKPNLGAVRGDTRLDSIQTGITSIGITVDSTVTLLLRQNEELRRQREALQNQVPTFWEKVRSHLFAGAVGWLVALFGGWLRRRISGAGEGD